MASNLSTIGFQFADEAQFREAMLNCAAAASREVACPAGRYAIWQSRTGAQIWFHLGTGEAGAAEIFGLTPFFEGKSEVSVALSQVVRRDDDNPFEGTLHGIVNPQPQEGSGYPIVFEAVDFALSAATGLPATRKVRLSAFARELVAHRDEEAYYAAHEASEQPQFAAQSFIPIGMFAAEQAAEGDNPAAAVPAPTAIFTGKVIEHNHLVNEASGRGFDWVLVETLDTTIDVVADPDVVRGEIVEGGTVEVSALLFGRVLE